MSLPDRAPVAVILAAGKGTRMKSRRPKVLFEVLGRTLVRRVVDAALEAGCSEVVVVVGHEAEQVRSSLGDVAGLVFAEQSGMQGTGQAVQDARSGTNLSGRTVLVLPGDVPLIEAETLRSLLAAHCGGVTVATMLPPDPSGYGRIVRDEGGKVVGIVEHRDATEAQRGIGEVNTSIYAIDGSFLAGSDGQSGAIGELSTDNAQEEYLLTDVVAIAASRGVPTESFVIEEARRAIDFIELRLHHVKGENSTNYQFSISKAPK